MTQPDELKPCPLPACGGEVKLQWKSHPQSKARFPFFYCPSCGLTSGIYGNEEDAATVWNYRPEGSRLLQLAAAMHWLHTTNSYGPLSEAAKAATKALKALTPEDIAHIKEISL